MKFDRLGIIAAALILQSTAAAQTFSVELGGPNWDFLGGNMPLAGDAILLPTVHVLPTPLGPFNHLVSGTAPNGINVDAYSFGYNNMAMHDYNLVDAAYFAVTRASTGLSGSGVNFEATENFGRLGEMPPILPGLPAANRGQAHDIFYSEIVGGNSTEHDDDGFWDGGITPNPAPGMALGFPNLTSGGNDAIDALDMRTGGLGSIGLGNIYFSIESGTRGADSGAEIFYGPQANGYGASVTSYATPTDLGLVAGDEITGLTVIDADGDFTDYDASAGDAVLFSLEPGSPSLASIPVVRPLNGNLAVPADIFVANSSGLAVFSRAEDLQLGIAPGSDAVNGIDFDFTDVPVPVELQSYSVD